MLSLDPSIYSPGKISIIKALIAQNIFIETTLLISLLVVYKLLPRYFSKVLVLTVIIELFIFSQGNIFTAPLQNLQPSQQTQDFGLSRYVSTSDVLDYIGPQVYWNHLRVRHPFGPDLGNQELDSFNRLRQEVNMLPGNLNMLSQKFNATGYSAVILKSYANFFNSKSTNYISVSDLSDDSLSYLGVNYIITGFPDDYAQGLTGFAKASSDPSVYQSLKPKPRAWLKSGQGSAQITSYQPQEVKVSTNSTGQDKLIFTDSLYPGWKASVNNQPVIINPHKQAFREVDIPPGINQVTLSYQPESVRIGSGLTLISALIALILYRWPNQKLLSSS